jgi:hypothetical protein
MQHLTSRPARLACPLPSCHTIAETTEAIAKERKSLQDFPQTKDEALIALRQSQIKHLAELQEELPRLLDERTRRGR